jgi:hypothetical protein
LRPAFSAKQRNMNFGPVGHMQAYPQSSATRAATKGPAINPKSVSINTAFGLDPADRSV